MLKRKCKLTILSSLLIASSILVQNTYVSANELEDKTRNSNVGNFQIKNKLLSENIISEINRLKTRKETLSKARMSKLPTQQIASHVTYQVVAGDNLTKIAKKFNVTIENIMEWNQLTSPDVIYAGQVLKVYTSSDKESAPIGEENVNDQQQNNSETGRQDDLNNGEDEIDSSDKESEINDEYQDEDIYRPTPDEYKLLKEKEIDEQLAREEMITTDPTTEGQAIYEKVLEIAHEQIGVPYLFAGNTPEGFDCSGFVRYVYFNAGLNIERKSSEDYFMKETTIIENPVPGDVVFFKNTYKAGISHMGVYIGDGNFIHAGNNGVEIASLELDYWNKRFVAFKRFNEIE